MSRSYYERVIAALGSAEVTETTSMLLSLAMDMDSAQKSIVEDAEAMACRYKKFADTVSTGYQAQDPGGYSTVADINRNMIRLEEKARTFRWLVKQAGLVLS